jgi:hypothetical protein
MAADAQTASIDQRLAVLEQKVGDLTAPAIAVPGRGYEVPAEKDVWDMLSESRPMIRWLLSFVLIAIVIVAQSTSYAQSQGRAESHNCRDAYESNNLPRAKASLLALQHQCELAVRSNSRPHMEYELAKSKLALLRIHIALHAVTAKDRALPDTIGHPFAGDAAAVLATIYKGKDMARYEAAIIRAAWLAASSQVPLTDAEAAIRAAIVIYMRRGDYASAGRLIEHLKEPVLSNQVDNGQLLIDLLQGEHAVKIRDAAARLVEQWHPRHVGMVGPIAYVIAEAYKPDDNIQFMHWLDVAEGNDFKEASVALNQMFFDFRSYDHVLDALKVLGFDGGLIASDGNVDEAALRKNIALFGAAALGSGLSSAYYTLQNNDLITKMRILSGNMHRVTPTQVSGVGRILAMDKQGQIQSTGFLANDSCTVMTALHALGFKLDNAMSLYLEVPIATGKVQRSQVHVVAMGKGTGIPTSPNNDWLVGRLTPCAPGDVRVAPLAEKDRAFDSTDNTFAFELSESPLPYFAVGFPGGADSRSLTLSPCILDQRIGYTLTFENTCYLHGMSGGPVYATDPSDGEAHDVVAINTELGETLDQSITNVPNAGITEAQRGVGTLSSVFAQAVWRTSQFETPSKADLARVNEQITKLGGGSGEAMNPSERASFVSKFIENHVPQELVPFWYYFGDLDKTNADTFLELTGIMSAESDWLPGVWCSDVGQLTITADGSGHWNVSYFEDVGNYGTPVILGENIIFKGAQHDVGDVDFIFRRRGADLYLIGLWKVWGTRDFRAENWVHVRTSKACRKEGH